MTYEERQKTLYAALERRILILDGATGTEIQKRHLTEADFRGQMFANHPVNLTGNNDVLSLTRPDAIRSVHQTYLDAGADLIETDTFNANCISQQKYQLADSVYDMTRSAAAIARDAADAKTALTPEKPRFVVGSIGPTDKTLSISPSVNDPALRDITFDELVDAYLPAVRGLLDGGADILMIETAFDTLNVKAAIYAISQVREERNIRIPIMISGTVSDASGRLLSGQTVSAFLVSVSHAPDLLSIGLNCALGAAEMAPYIRELAAHAPCLISMHPNAGLPDENGQYHQTPAEMAQILRSLAGDGVLNIAGGCCGTSPEYIREIAKALDGLAPHKVPTLRSALRLAGLEPFETSPDIPFTNIGERTNVAGSKKFLTLIRNKQYDEAVQIARSQVENGAAVIDVNMDDALLDTQAEMRNFLLRIAGEPDIAKVPVMIDASDWSVIEAGLKCVQGKCIVNSISLKEGEEKFLLHAAAAKRYGAAVLCMAFDESGQATTLDRRVSICRRMYALLTEKAHFQPDDIIFDVNVFAVSTGVPEHDLYGRDFIEAVRILKRDFPRCHFSGGISNVSFAFRGNNALRAALHSVFLYHAIQAGLDFGIVNPGQLAQYEDLPVDLRTAAEHVILATSPDAGAELLALAQNGGVPVQGRDANAVPEWRSTPLAERLAYCLIHGDEKYVKEDIDEALKAYPRPVDIIEGPLMAGMNEVGIRFGAGKMFLPQVVKTARVMKLAVAELLPYLQQGGDEAERHQVTVVLATVKGDVHDIGKNIVGVVLQCNNFKVIDLGVMVPAEKIVETAIAEKADIVALSGLITPSLNEMAVVAGEMERHGMTIPLMVGGAAAGKLHTALKLQPHYPSGIVVYTTDASQCATVALKLVNPQRRGEYIAQLKREYAELVAEHSRKNAAEPAGNISVDAVRSKIRPTVACAPKKPGITEIQFSAEDVLPLFDRSAFLNAWKVKQFGESAQVSADLWQSAQIFLEKCLVDNVFQMKGVVGLFPVGRTDSEILVYSDESRSKVLCKLPTPRKKCGDLPVSLCDFIAEENDHIGLFALSTGFDIRDRAAKLRAENHDFEALLLQFLANGLAEACAEYLHLETARNLWGYAPSATSAKDVPGIRPAFGYPICPDHGLKKQVFELLDVERRIGIHLTETMMMDPEASVCAMIVAAPESFYFAV